MTEDHRPAWDPKACTFCGKCENFCPAGSREIVGREYTVKELTKELMKDQLFYEESGGGVTFSGGEVMSMDMDFILAMAKELKRQDVTLTIDTCGYVPYERFEKILPYVNTFLYDVKVMDPELHKKYMGTDNKLILENLIRLSQDGARIYIRIPTIKEVNGNEENMKETIAFLKEHDIHRPGLICCRITIRGAESMRSWIWNIKVLICMRRTKRRWRRWPLSL